jgi:hypothetical protein
MVELYAGGRSEGAGILPAMGHGTFVLGAYVLVFGVLVTYWWRVESGIRTLEREGQTRPAEGRR